MSQTNINLFKVERLEAFYNTNLDVALNMHTIILSLPINICRTETSNKSGIKEILCEVFIRDGITKCKNAKFVYLFRKNSRKSPIPSLSNSIRLFDFKKGCYCRGLN